MLKLFGLGKRQDNALVAPSAGDLGRIYAVGDVHGRVDLLSAMIASIANDLEGWPGKPFQIVFLGDLIDRGASSRQVLDFARQLACVSDGIRFIKGNHEEVFLRVYDGDSAACEFFYKIGGRETLISYGLQSELGEGIGAEDLVIWMRENIPVEHVDFVGSFQDMILIGDYIFVHAGIRPKVALEKQVGTDLRWIRDQFLNYQRPHPGMVIHGHSISEEVDEQSNRVGIDTGAYRSGKLTAIVLEGQSRRFLTVKEGEFDGDESGEGALARLAGVRPLSDV